MKAKINLTMVGTVLQIGKNWKVFFVRMLLIVELKLNLTYSLHYSDITEVVSKCACNKMTDLVFYIISVMVKKCLK